MEKSEAAADVTKAAVTSVEEKLAEITKAIEKDREDRLRAFTDELGGLCKKHRCHVAARAFLKNDGTISAQPFAVADAPGGPNG